MLWRKWVGLNIRFDYVCENSKSHDGHDVQCLIGNEMGDDVSCMFNDQYAIIAHC